MRKATIEIKNKSYDLTLTRESVIWLESMGFSVEDFQKKPVTYYEILWASAFIANHPEVNLNLALKLRESYKEEGGDVIEIINFIFEEYQSFIDALADTKSIKKKATITQI